MAADMAAQSTLTAVLTIKAMLIPAAPKAAAAQAPTIIVLLNMVAMAKAKAELFMAEYNMAAEVKEAAVDSQMKEHNMAECNMVAMAKAMADTIVVGNKDAAAKAIQVHILPIHSKMYQNMLTDR